MHGNAKQTGGGLKKKDLKYNKHGKIVSKKASAIATKKMKGGGQVGGDITTLKTSNTSKYHLGQYVSGIGIRGDKFGIVYSITPDGIQSLSGSITITLLPLPGHIEIYKTTRMNTSNTRKYHKGEFVKDMGTSNISGYIVYIIYSEHTTGILCINKVVPITINNTSRYHIGKYVEDQINGYIVDIDGILYIREVEKLRTSNIVKYNTGEYYANLGSNQLTNGTIKSIFMVIFYIDSKLKFLYSNSWYDYSISYHDIILTVPVSSYNINSKKKIKGNGDGWKETENLYCMINKYSRHVSFVIVNGTTILRYNLTLADLSYTHINWHSGRILSPGFKKQWRIDFVTDTEDRRLQFTNDVYFVISSFIERTDIDNKRTSRPVHSSVQFREQIIDNLIEKRKANSTPQNPGQTSVIMLNAARRNTQHSPDLVKLGIPLYNCTDYYNKLDTETANLNGDHGKEIITDHSLSITLPFQYQVYYQKTISDRMKNNSNSNYPYNIYICMYTYGGNDAIYPRLNAALRNDTLSSESNDTLSSESNDTHSIDNSWNFFKYYIYSINKYIEDNSPLKYYTLNPISDTSGLYGQLVEDRNKFFVWRACILNEINSELFTAFRTFRIPQYVSTTSDKDITKRFEKIHDTVLLKIYFDKTCNCIAPISDISYFPDEKEFLIKPYTLFYLDDTEGINNPEITDDGMKVYTLIISETQEYSNGNNIVLNPTFPTLR
jgi:hypothetical protein